MFAAPLLVRNGRGYNRTVRGEHVLRKLESSPRSIDSHLESAAKIETISISEVAIPDSKLAREATELVRDTESWLLFNHSTRVYYFGALAGKGAI
jgi:hypothetical protein